MESSRPTLSLVTIIIFVLGLTISGFIGYRIGRSHLRNSILTTPSVSPSSQTNEKIVTFTILQKGNSGSPNLTNQIIHNQSEWEILSSKLSAYGTAFTLPSVNFTTDSIIIVSAGNGGHGNASVEIDKITDNGTSLIVKLTTEASGQGCLGLESFVTAYKILKIPKTTEKADFQVNNVETSCR